MPKNQANDTQQPMSKLLSTASTKSFTMSDMQTKPQHFKDMQALPQQRNFSTHFPAGSTNSPESRMSQIT
jgi:hypothetical protein